MTVLPETVVLSHGHNDHTGGLPSLSEGTVCTGAAAVDYLRAALPDCRIETPRAGDILTTPLT